MKLRLIMIMISIIILGLITSTTSAKRPSPNPVKSVIKDGIEYSASLDPNKIGFVMATWLKTNRVIWIRQIYVVKYEYKRGLEEDVQWVFISNLFLAGTKLIVTNELGYEYELDLASLAVKVLKGHIIIDNSTVGQFKEKTITK